MPAAAAPQHAVLLRDFANTLDVDGPADFLATPGDLADWLRDSGLLEGSAEAADDDLALARRLRDVLRTAFRAHDDVGSTDPCEAMEEVAPRLPLALRLCGTRPTLVPVEAGVRGALTWLLVAAADCGADGSWRRLKICADDSCAWAFYDTSKNLSRTWCSMEVCGNRAKTRSYRARRAPAS